MANFHLPEGIASISGTLATVHDRKLVAKTYRRPDGTKESRLYLMPKCKRATPPSDKEIAQRQRFRQMAQEVAKRIADGDTRPRKIIWEEVKNTLL